MTSAIPWLARALVALAAGLAWRVALARPRHRPVWVALSASLALDLLLASGWPPSRPALAIHLAAPALSAWAVLACLGRRRRATAEVLGAWGTFAAWSLLAPRPGLWWGVLPVVAHLLALARQTGALAAWALESRPATVTERVLLVMLAGDLGATLVPLLLGGPWVLAQAIAGATAATLAVLQARDLRVSEPC